MARVVVVTTSYPRFPGDAAGHFVQTEARQRAHRGDSVVVIAPGPGTSPDDGVHVEWVGGGDAFGHPGALARLRERPTRLLSAGAFVAFARRALARAGPAERTIAHFVVPSGWPIADRTGSLEVVAHGSDVRLLEGLPRRACVFVVRRLLERGATFRFVSSELASRLARATLPEVLERSRIEPCPIDVRSAPTRTAARARLGVGADERLAVVVGRLIRSKRADVAVRLSLQHAVDRVVVVGGGPDAARIPKLPSVEMKGQLLRDEALAWIAAADLLVSASREEGAPTAIREARALGVPVVAVPSGDLASWAAADPGITLVDA